MSASHITPYLLYINAHLHNAVLACRAAQEKTSTESPSFSNSTFLPAKNLSINGDLQKQTRHLVESGRETPYSKSAQNSISLVLPDNYQKPGNNTIQVIN